VREIEVFGLGKVEIPHKLFGAFKLRLIPMPAMVVLCALLAEEPQTVEDLRAKTALALALPKWLKWLADQEFVLVQGGKVYLNRRHPLLDEGRKKPKGEASS